MRKLLLLFSINAFAAESWMSASAFNAKEGALYGSREDCESKHQDCVGIDGKDMDYTSYLEGRFVEDESKKNAKQAAQLEHKQKQGSRAARAQTCNIALAEINPDDALKQADIEVISKCALVFMIGR